MATGGLPPDDESLNKDISLEADIIKAMPNQEFDEAVNAMQSEISKEIADQSPLVGDKYHILHLLEEYADDDAIYLEKINALSERYTHVRTTRRDGNCFYRAFIFGYLEQLLSNKETFDTFRARASEAKDHLEKLGYPSFTVEDFHDQFISVVDSVRAGMPLEGLLNIVCDDGLSNYLVVYLRLITSCHLQRNQEFFQNFVDGYDTIQDFCKVEVEPMDKESDHIHIIALTQALDLCVRVAYVDRAGGSDITYHDFPEGSTPQLHLLYRPGHYDVVYPS